MELLIVTLLISVGCSIAAYLAATASLRRRTHSDEFDLGAIETRLASLVSDLTHVANSHANAVEDRKGELKRVIEMANERVRKLNSLLSDLEIIEKRIRGSAEELRGTRVEDDLVRTVRLRAPDRQDRHEEIRSRAVRGESASGIAAALRLPLNEVEMVVRGMEKGR